MDLREWDERYRSAARPEEDLEAPPTPLVARIAKILPPGKALDLACGAGRNALWLARQGWNVSAVDGSKAAIGILRRRAVEMNLAVDADIADLENGEYVMRPGCWDLIVIAYYLQLDLIERAKIAVKPDGVIIVIVHMAAAGEAPTKHRLLPGELIRRFDQWEILHSFEGRPEDTAHRRLVAEVAARKPVKRSL
ncbi:MAG TPA: methyltransferase domain-containing protein [Bryobacteraceae bacterium]|jgi:SAM-dependent methyltransferase